MTLLEIIRRSITLRSIPERAEDLMTPVEVFQARLDAILDSEPTRVPHLDQLMAELDEEDNSKAPTDQGD
jgi:hypothetical protein